MGTSQVPVLIDRLVKLATDALNGNPEVTVYDGFGVSGNSGDFLMFGVDDPESLNAGISGSADQVPGPMGSTRPRDQNGQILCAAYSLDHSRNQKVARDAVYSYMAVVENFLREDPSLGIAAGGLFVAQMGDLERLSQNQNGNGADALLVFNVRFRARI